MKRTIFAIAAMAAIAIAVAVSLPLSNSKSNAAELTIDATNQETVRASIAAIKATLPEDRRAAFETAVQAAVFNYVAPGPNLLAAAGAMSQLAQDPEKMMTAVRAAVGGKTAAQIFAMTEARNREQALGKITEAEAAVKEAEADLATLTADDQKAEKILSSLVVTAPVFKWQKTSTGVDPIISFKLANKSEKAISWFSMRGTLVSQGRSVPWLSEGFNHKVAGGIEPGEEKTFDLAPNRFGEWGKAPKDRTDLVLNLVVTGAKDASGVTIAERGIAEIERAKIKLNEAQNKLADVKRQAEAAK